MTHPADKVYRFSTQAHWGGGLAENFLFDRSDGGVLRTPGALTACCLARAPKGAGIAALAADPCGRILWLQTDGTLLAAQDGRAVQVARNLHAGALGIHRLIWGQNTGWLIAGSSILRIDTATGDRTGAFDDRDWRVVDAVADRCDGVVVAETRDGALRLRRIRPEGRASVLANHDGFTEVMAVLRWTDRSELHVIDLIEGEAFRVVTLAPGGAIIASDVYSGPKPQGPATMDGPGRLILAADGGLFTVAFGLAESVRQIAAEQSLGKISALLWTGGALYAATDSRIWMLDGASASEEPVSASYFSPVLHSPLGDRTGWLRADLLALLPQSARVRITSRAFATANAAAAYTGALRSDPRGALVREGWTENSASEHFGDGSQHPLRHHLGDETAEFLALRLEVSVPACAEAARLKELDVLYPNRSLIEDLPAIYRTGTSGEIQVRRMLAPFQALADGLDDRISDSVRRVDPDSADDLWAGFLLGWLGHGDFANLPAPSRRKLLRALPDILPLRGTIAGLIRVMTCLAPEGFSIEDSGSEPDYWILPKAGDPAGPRLGRETPVAGHLPGVLVLGDRTPLGRAVLKHGCLDLDSLARCSAVVTVRIRGGDGVETRLGPFTERIARHFAPAHTRIDFVFGDNLPGQGLERATGRGPDDDGGTLIRLDNDQSRALGAWRLPRGGSEVPDHTPVLDSAQLNGSLILE